MKAEARHQRLAALAMQLEKTKKGKLTKQQKELKATAFNRAVGRKTSR
jgi:hypothetical protein